MSTESCDAMFMRVHPVPAGPMEGTNRARVRTAGRCFVKWRLLAPSRLSRIQVMVKVFVAALIDSSMLPTLEGLVPSDIVVT
jgi:hypothetical protein